MKGLELAEKFYIECGKETIEREFEELLPRIAVGLAGQGSECFGFDDEISRDHDFEPGFCIWITNEDYEKYGFKLERMYAKLPKEFKGYKRLTVSPVGGNRHGVMTIDEFYSKCLGSPSLPTELCQWLYIPHEALATACNGKVFCDKLGKFSSIRNKLLMGYPEDVRLKKIAAHTIMMSQAGLYNYNRLIKRGETGAAQLAVFEFVKHTISLVYLLNNKYEPFYKWAYRGMRTLDILSDLEPSLVGLTELGNSEIEAEAKRESMEQICKVIAGEFVNQGLTDSAENDFEKIAFSVQNKICDLTIRNMHIMEGI